jgi:hypothetical protein
MNSSAFITVNPEKTKKYPVEQKNIYLYRSFAKSMEMCLI